VLNALFQYLNSTSESLALSSKLILLVLLLCSVESHGQSAIDSILNKLDPGEWCTVTEEKLFKFRCKILSETEHALQNFQKHETKLIRGLSYIDSFTAQILVSKIQAGYQQLIEKINDKTSTPARLGGEYLSYFDSLKGSLFFLSENKDVLTTLESSKLNDALGELKELQSTLHRADVIKQVVQERQQKLIEILGQYTLPRSISKALKNYSKEIYYYSKQIREYKEMFRDPDKLLRKALTLFNRLPAFQQFMKDHSELGNLFTMPPNYSSALAVMGLQTKNQVQRSMANHIGNRSASVGQVFGQQIQSAQSQLEQFKQKINALGGISGNLDMPDFKLNSQHGRTFLRRLEYGTNIQTTKANFIFPSTTDLAFTIGYRINDKKIVGVAIAGKIGWGKDIHNISVTGQGLGIRTFMDIKIKNSFYASGGLECNYQQPFSEIQQLHDLDLWSRSGLIGATKIVSVNSKIFRKTKIQLLWDFLSYCQLPRTEPIKFRVGYNF